jgi:hypothetical protein
MAFDTSSDFGKPDPKWCVMTSRTSKPASSSAVAVQWDVRGSAQTSPCAAGFRTRRHARNKSANASTQPSLPPWSWSQLRPMNEIPAGGSVTSASQLAGGNAASTARASPW